MIDEWTLCKNKLPKEHNSMFAKYKGTKHWRNGMFERCSEDVNVTVEFEDGTRKTKTSHTLDGEWVIEMEKYPKQKVIAWQPLPEPWKEEECYGD